MAHRYLALHALLRPPRRVRNLWSFRSSRWAWAFEVGVEGGEGGEVRWWLFSSGSWCRSSNGRANHTKRREEQEKESRIAILCFLLVSLWEAARMKVHL
jgi:hypothetical protein